VTRDHDFDRDYPCMLNLTVQRSVVMHFLFLDTTKNDCSHLIDDFMRFFWRLPPSLFSFFGVYRRRFAFFFRRLPPSLFSFLPVIIPAAIGNNIFDVTWFVSYMCTCIHKTIKPS
jgi:hypothetical protein